MTIASIVLGIMMSVSVSQAQVEAEPQVVYEYVGTYTVTAYNYSEGGGENYYTAGGYTPTPYYTVATTDEFPIGTILYIEDLGEVQVQDRGNFRADWIDLHIGYDPINSWDMREREVYIVRKE